MKRCYSCFKEYNDSLHVCPHCGHEEIVEPEEPVYLMPGTLLANRYIIGMSVGSGGFGVVYKAWDSKLDVLVAIKEYFPRRIVTRAQGQKDLIVAKKYQEEFDYRRNRFLSEARSMAKLGNHRSIPNVFEFFDENNTSYIVMELLIGMPLNEYLDQNEGVVSSDFAILIANEVGKALESLHKHDIIHRDVAPDNIYICQGKEISVKLMDLGAARLADDTDNVIDIVLKPGYSPTEQYDNSKTIGPWTDIYALGATIYRMLTGDKPDESTNRKIEDTVVPPREINPLISENMNNTIMKAMAVDRHMRFQNVGDFLSAINGDRKVITLAEERKRRKLKRGFGIIAALLIVGVLGSVVGTRFYNEWLFANPKPADITVWLCATDNQTVGDDSLTKEEEAFKVIIKDFTSEGTVDEDTGEIKNVHFPQFTINVESIPESEYIPRLREAVEKGEMPNLFESTGIPDDLLDHALDLKDILDRVVDPQKDENDATKCFFLDQFENYYGEVYNRIPLGIEAPMAVVITNGEKKLKYTKDTFSSIDDFKASTEDEVSQIAISSRYRKLVEENLGKGNYHSEDTFFNPEGNESTVLLTSTMMMNELRVDEATQVYDKSFVHYDANEVKCAFTYEWSVGNGTKPQIAASKRLLEWMLGANYQNRLMIRTCQDGQIPVNEKSFEEKVTQTGNLEALNETKEHFVFSSEMRDAMRGEQ